MNQRKLTCLLLHNQTDAAESQHVLYSHSSLCLIPRLVGFFLHLAFVVQVLALVAQDIFAYFQQCHLD